MPSVSKVYTITDEGLRLLEERGEERFGFPPKMARAVEMRKSLMKLGAAVMDGTRDGDEETIKKISEIVNKARKDVYSILADSSDTFNIYHLSVNNFLINDKYFRFSRRELYRRKLRRL